MKKFVDALVSRLERLVVWRSSARRDLSGNTTDRLALVSVIGREHYSESTKAYPIRSWLDAFRVARNECQNDGMTLVHVGDWVEPSRTVTFFKIESDLDLSTEKSLLLLPEGLLAARSLSADEIAEIEREGLRYFVSARGNSQISGGLISSADSYALAVGLPDSVNRLKIEGPDLQDRIRRFLWRLRRNDWPGFLHPLFGGVARAKGVILGKSLAIIIALHVVIVSGYLLATSLWRERQIESLGPQVNTLLSAQRDVSRLGDEVAELNAMLSMPKRTHDIWRVASIVWKNGGTLTDLGLLDGKVTIRGTASVATDVLGALTKEVGMINPRFVAPVRQSGDRQEFSIELGISNGGAKP